MLVSVVWGEKYRHRTLGDRADFCEECFTVSRHRIAVDEIVSHLYLIPLGNYKEMRRFCECTVCGNVYAVSKDRPLISGRTATSSTMQDLIDATNPNLLETITKGLAEIDANTTDQYRRQRQMWSLCENGTATFPLAKQQISGWIGLLAIIFVGVAIHSFFFAAWHSETIGWTIAGFLTVLLIWIRNCAIHEYVAVRVKPRLKRFIAATGISMMEIESALAEKKIQSPMMRRHFATGRYNDVRRSRHSKDKVERYFIRIPWAAEQSESSA